MRKSMENPSQSLDSNSSQGSLVDVHEMDKRNIKSTRVSSTTTLTSEMNVMGNNAYDIICTKSKKYDNSEGNKLFREQIELYADEYDSASRARKTEIRQTILDTLRDDKKCQFISENKKDSMNDKQICDKITHALRYHKSKTPNDEVTVTYKTSSTRSNKRRRRVVETLKKTLAYIPRCRNQKKSKIMSSIFRRPKPSQADPQFAEPTKSSHEFTIDTCDSLEYKPSSQLISPAESVFTKSDTSLDYDEDNLPRMSNDEYSLFAYFMESSDDSVTNDGRTAANSSERGTVAEDYKLPFDITLHRTKLKSVQDVSVKEKCIAAVDESEDKQGDKQPNTN